MGYVRLLVEPQSQLVSLDGLMRNGLVSELKAGLPQKVLRKGKRGQNLGVGPGMGHILPIGIVQYPYVPENGILERFPPVKTVSIQMQKFVIPEAKWSAVEICRERG